MGLRMLMRVDICLCKYKYLDMCIVYVYTWKTYGRNKIICEWIWSSEYVNVIRLSEYVYVYDMSIWMCVWIWYLNVFVWICYLCMCIRDYEIVSDKVTDMVFWLWKRCVYMYSECMFMYVCVRVVMKYVYVLFMCVLLDSWITG